MRTLDLAACSRLNSVLALTTSAIIAILVGGTPTPSALEMRGQRLTQYEVEGFLIQRGFAQDGGLKAELRSVFRVFVKDCGWLIESIESNRFGSWIRRREVGCTNGSEIFEVVIPFAVGETQILDRLNPWRSIETSSQQPQVFGSSGTACIVSNSVPVSFSGEAVFPHLWLMFASQCFFDHLETKQLTPVFDITASVLHEPNLKIPADWILAEGPLALPREISYHNQGGTIKAKYAVVGFADEAGIACPTGFVFEEFPTQYQPTRVPARPLKSVTATVTAFRRICSRTNLLPATNSRTLVNDVRLMNAQPPISMFSYFNPSSAWISAVKARSLHDGKEDSPRFAPTSVVGVLVLFLAPLFFSFLWKRLGKRKA